MTVGGGGKLHFVQRAWIAILAVAALTASVLPANIPANALGEDPAAQIESTATPEPTSASGNTASASELFLQSISPTEPSISDPANSPKITLAQENPAHPIAGTTISASQGTWAGTTPILKKFQWFICSGTGVAIVNPADCQEIPGATRSVLLVPEPDVMYVHQRLAVRVTANNDATGYEPNSGVSAWSTTTDNIYVAPIVTDDPVVLDARQGQSARKGDTLTADFPSWDSMPAITERETIQWISCTSALGSATSEIPSTCANISGATTGSYQLKEADLGKYVTFKVTAKNLAGTTTVAAATSPQVSTLPATTGAPAVFDSASNKAPTALRTGQVLKASGAAWTGNPTPTKSYKWFDCVSAVTVASSTLPAGCAEITNATSATFTVTNDQSGKFIIVGEFAANPATAGISPVAKYSLSNSKVAPVNTGQVSISGTALVGEQLSSNSGTWVGADENVAYQWVACSAAITQVSGTLPATCSVISGATSNTFTLTKAQNGKHVALKVTKRNAGGETFQVSSSVGVVNEIPTLTVPTVTITNPVIGSASTPKVGSTLKSTSAAAGFPTPTVSKQWYACSTQDNTDCEAIPNATGVDYLIASGYDGKYIYVEYTATNSVGDTVSASVVSNQVLLAPVISSSPVISGNTTVGSTLTVSGEDANMRPTSSATYEWFTCTATGASTSDTPPSNCRKIPAAPATRTYVLVDSNKGSFIRAKVTFTNSAGTATRWSASTSVISTAPATTGTPTLSIKNGTAVVTVPKLGYKITATAPTWTGTPAPTSSFQWYICDTAHVAGTSVPGDCEIVPGATTATWEIDYRANAKFVAALVTGSNASGDLAKFSATTTASSDPDSSNKSAATMTGAPALSLKTAPAPAPAPRLEVNSTLVATGFTIAGTPTPTLKYQWFGCDTEVTLPGDGSEPAGCTEIAATAVSEWKITSAANDKFVMVKVTATNISGAAVTKYSASTSAKSMQKPAMSSQPVVTGAAKVGQAVNATVGNWSGSATDAAYESSWLICTAPITTDFKTATNTIPQTCSILQGGGSDNPVVTPGSYTLTTDEGGKYVAFRTSATNSAGSETRISKTQLVAQAPENTLFPTVTVNSPANDGAPKAGGTVTTSGGTWKATPAIDPKTYQWYTCSVAVEVEQTTVDASCDRIAGATTIPLNVTPAMSGKYLAVLVTAKNSQGTATAFTKTVGPVASAPTSSQPPTVTGNAQVGLPLQGTSGTWVASSPSLISEFGWIRCDKPIQAVIKSNTDVSLPAGCSDVSGASGPGLPSASFTYQTSNLDAGKYIALRVTVSNTAGLLKQISLTSAQVKLAPIATGTAPTISIANGAPANPKVGSTLTANSPVWTAIPAVSTSAYQWYSCDNPVTNTVQDVPGDCVQIANATAKTYAVTSAVNGHHIIAKITGTNTAGSGVSITTSVGPVVDVPQSVQAPSVGTGLAKIPGGSFAGDTGQWAVDANATDTTYSYQWLRCSSAVTTESRTQTLPAGCVAISGAIQQAYTLDNVNDNGKFLALRVAASNVAGTSYRTSITSHQVSAAAPILDTTVPSIVERTKPWIARTITAANGTWKKTAPISAFSYQWYSCTSANIPSSEVAPNGCTEIVGATEKTYVVTVDDQAKSLLVSVTAVNDFGSTTRFTQSTVSVLQEPAVISPPALSGNFLPQYTITSTRGTWEGEGAISFAQQWWVCTSEVPEARGTVPPGCTQIPTATGVSYIPTTSQIGKFVTMEERATNVTGDYVSSWAQSRLVIAEALANKTVPVASVTTAASNKAPKVGGAVTVSAGTWTGTPAPAMNYNWLACDASVIASAVITVTQDVTVESLVPAGCVSVADGSSASYIVEQSVVGKYLSAVVTATNRVNEKAYRTASLAGTVTSAPVSGDTAPTVAGPPHVGTQLQALNGTWNATPAPSFTYEWAVCNSEVTSSSNALPAGCSLVTTEKTSTFVIKAANLGKFIISKVTATNVAGAASKWTASTAAITNGAAASKTPLITGNPVVGQTLTTDGGTWVGTPAPIREYQWFACATEVPSVQFTQHPNCSEIPEATGSTFTLTAEQFGDGYDLNGTFVTVRVTGLSSGGNSIIFPKTTPVISSLPVALTASPVSINTPADAAADSAIEGTPLTVTAGEWNGTPAPTLSYQWFLCSRAVTEATSSKPSQCSSIAGATTSSFTPTKAQRAKYLVVQETGSNPASKLAGRSDSLWSASTNPVTAIPTNQTVPVVTVQNGLDATTPLVGGTVSSTVGTWDSYPMHVYDYQWFACTAALTATSTNQGSLCTAIEGAQSLTLTVPADAVSKFLAMRVTASNSSGEKAKWTASTKAVAETPNNTVAPSVSKTSESPRVAVGETLTANTGTWRGAPALVYSYKWFRCSQESLEASDQVPSGCSEILNATSSTYKPLRTDVAVEPNQNFLTVRVTAKSAGVSVSKWSATTGVIKEEPLNIKPQTIKVNGGTTAGEPKVGGTVEMVAGEWYGDPTPAFTKQWLSCSTKITTASDSLPAGCENIPGEQASTLVVTSALAGKYLVLAVTGENYLKARTKWSVSTALVTEAPANTVAPSVVGRPFVQGTLTADGGTWTGTRTPVLSYEWYTCPNQIDSAGDTKPAACSVIAGATSATYKVTSANRGFILAKVKGTNSAGSLERWTASTTEAVSTGPVNTVEISTSVTNGATVAGATVPKIGSTITGNSGTWVGNTTPTTTRQWYECTAAVPASTYTQPSNCVALGVASETGPTPITVTTAMAGKYYSLLVTAHNQISPDVKRWSKSTGMVHEAPTLLTQPTLSGNAEVSAVLTGTGGEWRGSPAPTYTYKWFVCDNPIATGGVDKQPDKCFDRQVSGLSYTIRDGDFGKYLSLRVTATNALTSTTRFTATSGKVVSPPRVMAEPTVKIGTTTGETRPKVGGVVTTMGGSWAGSTPMNFTTQWLVCDQEVTAPSDVQPEGCREIGAASTPKTLFTLPREASNKYIMVKVTADNGSVLSRWSRSTSLAAAAPPMPIDGAHPTVSGELKTGMTLSAQVGTWSSDPALVIVDDEPVGTIKQWYVCENPVPEETFDLPAGCISQDPQQGNTAYQYTVQELDAGKFITFAVTVRNSAGQVTQMWTAAPDGIEQAPDLFSSPKIITPTSGASNGKFLTGFEVSIEDAVFTGTPAPTSSYQWFKCDKTSPLVSAKELTPEDQTVPIGCVEIINATANKFVPTDAEVGKLLMVRIVARNTTPGTSTVFSPTSSSEVIQAPRREHIATISGVNKVGSDLTLTGSTWNTSTSAATKIGWLICTQQITEAMAATLTAVPNFCKQQSGATTVTYTIPDSTSTKITGGRYISAVETLTFTGFQKFDRIAASTGQIIESPRVSTSPSLGGTFTDPLVGGSLSITDGTWFGFPEPGFTYSWYTCSSPLAYGSGAPSGCDLIAGQSAATLAILADYNTKYIVGVVTATNSEGVAIAHSTSTVRAVRQVPVNVSPPIVSGNPSAGSTLTVIAGQWTASPSVTTSYEWAACTTDVPAAVATLPATCTKIPGQTGTTLNVPRDVMGKRIVAFEKASNGTADKTMSSVATSAVTASPVSVSAPQLSVSQPVVGETLTVGQDTWSAFPAVQTADKTYVWYECDPLTSSTPIDQGCEVITGATTNTITVAAAQRDKKLMARVTANNGISPSSASYTNRSSEVIQRLEVTNPAEITEDNGSAVTANTVLLNNDVVRVTPAVWEGTNNLSTPAFKWFLCSGTATSASATLPPSCSAISPVKTGNTLTILAGWAGKRIVVSETKTNSLGTVTRYSASTVIPVNEPVLDSSAPLVGDTVTVSATTVGTPFANTVTYSWYLCTTKPSASSVLPSTCSVIPSQSSASLSMTSAYVGKYITAAVTTAVGTTRWAAAPAAVVKQVPVNTDPISISGDEFVGGVLTATPGTWTGSPVPNVTSQWYSCTQDHLTAAAELPADCSPLSGQTASTLTVTSAMAGKFILVRELANNGTPANSPNKYFSSASTGQILEAPRVTSDVSVATTSPVVGDTVSAVVGIWAGTESPTLSYQWFACDAQVSAASDQPTTGCVEIALATSSSYLVDAAYIDKYLMVRETAENSMGIADRWSRTTGAVQSSFTIGNG